VCGKAARTVLCGGRAMKRTSLPLQRRDFIAGLGSAAAWPVVARAQPTDGMRRIGVLTQYPEGDPLAAVNIKAFGQKMRDLGWTEGHNVAVEYRWTAADPALTRRFAAELIAQHPNALMASTGPTLEALLQATRTIPIVFTSVLDPVGSGLIESLARPGGNATGFTLMEWGISGKWLELLKQISPQITRVAVIRDPSTPGGSGQFGALQAAAPSSGVELRPVDSRDGEGIERAITAFAQQPNGGLIVTAASSARLHRRTIIVAAARHKLPTVYPFGSWVADDGGLISYGSVQVELWRLAAGYMDRILRGERPADLPVQAPTRYETVLNLKTAQALGLNIPETLLATADEVIQ
jgi:putative tryptophan/tyrosine transport system substrate-binding protein